MYRSLGAILLAGGLVLAAPVAGPAAEFTVWSNEVRVSGGASGVIILILNFWDKPVECAIGRLREGRWMYRVRYRESFKVLLYDLTAEDVKDLAMGKRVQAFQDALEGVKAEGSLECPVFK